MKIAALGDLHCQETVAAEFTPLFEIIAKQADILLLLGDLTFEGHPEEAKSLATLLSAYPIPILSVLGNHDYDQNQQLEIKKIFKDSGIKVLDGENYIYQNVGFAGVKGFCGGFASFMLPVFGEEISKTFAREAVNEALRLEKALTNLDTKKKIVLLHYAPIFETTKGEPLEIVPFLGSSHLAEPLDHFDVKTVFHGHAHMGSLEGKTLTGVQVYNASYPLLKKITPQQPFCLVQI